MVVAAVYVLLVLPPLLALFGKRLFWPFIPKVGAKPLTDHGVWHRIAAAVARRPGRVAVVAIAGDTLVDFGQGLEIPPEWLPDGVTREQVTEGLRPLLERPVEHVLATHGGPTDRAALERALRSS